MAKLFGEWSEPPRSPLLTYICKTVLTASKSLSYLPQKRFEIDTLCQNAMRLFPAFA